MGLNTSASNQQQLEQNKISAKAIIQLARWLQMESSLLPIAMSHSMRIAFHIFGVEQSQLPLLGPSGSTLIQFIKTIYNHIHFLHIFIVLGN